ncbi:3,4-dihydroxy-9,10-secoandrosta-1,3,5(10)-triene-9,17-dione 4,5-dioxygenase [Solimonas aquatica]|uniref:3,4-dihydroxy-9,10-secoandrosta-1,3,5(10)-triene-9,17-dione 4,5-dioxygenase n=1 Tax=Solimonas aquatica TaxID=489703 RepID=A0A1H9JH01_9GAMM|nr:VOC family protein [Solimonas aquatica]SEQ86194.1 3,4-dihydroxy-9,10-secoandrosta-1,3,5(10)-triene-9,17-dione 4,5-dioxygenase [Solimonas aquatica]
MQTIEALAYIVVESRDPAQWRHYAEQVLGMQAIAADGGLQLKMDEREFRIAVQPGATDRYLISGWQAVNEAAYRQALAALDRAGVALTRGSGELAQQRRVRELVAFSDPAGNRHELSWGYTGASSAFVSPIGVSGFKTGVFGLGHTVLPAIPFDETRRLFCEVLGMGVSDVFNFQPGPDAPVIRLHFLHGASGRHHSLALAEMPNPAGCVHMMVEVANMREVGLAHDRMQKHGVKLMATLGEHENDQMTSFYMMTPGNFAVEYGYGGLIVDPASWQTTQTKQVSIWGHDFSVGFR